MLPPSPFNGGGRGLGRERFLINSDAGGSQFHIFVTFMRVVVCAAGCVYELVCFLVFVVVCLFGWFCLVVGALVGPLVPLLVW